jgi:GAF domain-containing protein
MGPYSTLDRTPNAGESGRAEDANSEGVLKAVLPTASVAQTRRVTAASGVGFRFPAEDAGQSLADMAGRDLDAALQLLSDRAQYITGASGAAIALRRNGKNDMLCRATSGSNAPELGALLSSEFGLSGESVRTRKALRCDDAERDARVNREVCRQLGIASVVVMPVVHDDEILGVFELFSGSANAFNDRDLSALQRMTEMVETAVRLARAAENLPERLRKRELAAGGVVQDQDQDADEEILELDDLLADTPVAAAAPVIPTVAPAPMSAAPAVSLPPKIAAAAAAAAVVVPSVAPVVIPDSVPVVIPASPPVMQSAPAAVAKKPLFWSAALSASPEAEKSSEFDLSHVPPVLRKLHKCHACGFPVSATRLLCVECEEKKWRGQLRRPAPVAMRADRPELTAQQGTVAAAAAAGFTTSASVARPAALAAVVAPAIMNPKLEADAAPQVSANQISANQDQAMGSVPSFVLTAGLEPPQSWISANKYVVGTILLVAAAAAAFFLLR